MAGTVWLPRMMAHGNGGTKLLENNWMYCCKKCPVEKMPFNSRDFLLQFWGFFVLGGRGGRGGHKFDRRLFCTYNVQQSRANVGISCFMERAVFFPRFVCYEPHNYGTIKHGDSGFGGFSLCVQSRTFVTFFLRWGVKKMGFLSFGVRNDLSPLGSFNDCIHVVWIIEQ